MIIAIFTCEKHLAISKFAIAYYKRFLSVDLTVVGPRCIANHFKDSGCLFICDEDICGYEILKSINDQFNIGSNWYLQQFLKIAFYIESREDVLIIDGDTIISRSIFENVIDHNVAYYTAERVNQYNKLLVNSGTVLSPSDKSYICNFGFFEKGNRHFYSNNIYQFIDGLAQLVIENQKQEKKRHSSLDFSEYQINGQISEDKRSAHIQLKIFRRADLLIRNGLRLENLTASKLDEFFQRYDCISYENDHRRSYIMSIVAELCLLFRRSW
jgi:hypothetical protein